MSAVVLLSSTYSMTTIASDSPETSSAKSLKTLLEQWCEKTGLGQEVAAKLLRDDFDVVDELTVLSAADIDSLALHLELSFGKKAKLLKGIRSVQPPPGPMSIAVGSRMHYPSAAPRKAAAVTYTADSSVTMSTEMVKLSTAKGSIPALDRSWTAPTTPSTLGVAKRERMARVPSVDDLLADSTVSADSKVKALAMENERLADRLAISERRLYAGMGVGMSASAVGGGLSRDDIARIQHAFDGFDIVGNSCIDNALLGELLSSLGERLTESELKLLVKELDTEGNGEISFGGFLGWWQRAHKGGKKGKRYRQRFKLQAALLGSVPGYLESSSAEMSPLLFDSKRLVVKHVGRKGTAEYRVGFHYQQMDGKLQQISPWHDIPLHGAEEGTYNFISEVPKWTRAKFEIATGEPFNPIHQDIKHGKLRFYQWGDMMFNYGALPQTWEDPLHSPTDTGMPGDNDPIDAIEIGTKQLATGSVTPVRVLGVLALLDSGETDWKVLVINAMDPLSTILNDVHDIEKHVPGAIDAIREYLRIYKVCTGSAENQYALRGEALNCDYAIKVIKETHGFWKQLLKKGKKSDLSLHRVADSPSPLS